MTQPRNTKTLMTWNQRPHRDHVLAALGVVIGLLTVALLVTAIVVIDQTAAHAAQPGADPTGLRELGGAVLMLTTITLFAIAWHKIADLIGRRRP